ncbi:RidA family protein [Pseudomonas syringae pv. tagetis]|uniref:Endoribonuclease L-PSP family protein n=2 Tax=Pseudomonas syringae group genomosp. 7 TaxID=251699 RepID=A0A0Q0GTY4_9PSED|nr:RidA family protein [Pseudomonas syringae group genomosp. 7]KPX45977.1 Endoribonuclease L-PSP family protein [Pseudomonas syringae pv. helianthi]KPY80550.1 Endoribonuclease L-PSP family protein [Pseudomonas syringae pv. tagetis]RMR08981.1 Endoribonuclease L-PSP protein [Pseudomonas syringae pv. helianthi]RMV51160.1 Endoribonuclease L-PSP protein [Pseudomonas syringae pv. helianthi]RMW12579.1 Endoribonuclease L-PSP protein [Pseudomonas syringae pv. tagetis]
MAGDIGLIRTALAAAPGGHYSQAVLHQGTLHVSGQLPVRADGSPSVEQPFEVQAAIALDNLLAILSAAGCGTDDLLKVTVYVAGIQHWPAFDRIYAGYLGEHRPARAVVPVAELHHGYLIEIEALARSGR